MTVSVISLRRPSPLRLFRALFFDPWVAHFRAIRKACTLPSSVQGLNGVGMSRRDAWSRGREMWSHKWRLARGEKIQVVVAAGISFCTTECHTTAPCGPSTKIL